MGNTIGDTGDECAAVMWFCSACHLMKAALLRDPRWDDLRSLQTISPDLIPDDRYTGHHQGRRRRVEGAAPEWGNNDLVLKLYRPAAGSYDRLHQASILVRYGVGLPAAALPPLRACIDQLMDMDSREELEAPLLHEKGNPQD